MPSTGSAIRRAEALVAAALLFAGGCAAAEALEAPEAPFTLRLIGVQTIDHRLQFGGTTVGGLSGIDYDPEADLVYLVSDDRGTFAPPRFYVARARVDGSHVDVSLLSVVTLQVPVVRQRVDVEAIRFDRRAEGLWWASEGEPGVADPFVGRATIGGTVAAEVPLPAMFRFAGKTGPSGNRVFEGASLSVDGASLWVAMEGPLKQDGPMPTNVDGAWSRFSRFDRDASSIDFGPIAGQFAYRIDPVPSEGAFGSRLTQNGVSEILAFESGRLLVLERAYVLGRGWRARLFVADVDGATDVRAMSSLADQNFDAMPKRLVVDFDRFGIPIDNFEGLCFGPVLTNGNRTLLMVSDDNFNPGQTTRIVAFELLRR